MCFWQADFVSFPDGFERWLPKCGWAWEGHLLAEVSWETEEELKEAGRGFDSKEGSWHTCWSRCTLPGSVQTQHRNGIKRFFPFRQNETKKKAAQFHLAVLSGRNCFSVQSLLTYINCCFSAQSFDILNYKLVWLVSAQQTSSSQGRGEETNNLPEMLHILSMLDICTVQVVWLSPLSVQHLDTC